MFGILSLYLYYAINKGLMTNVEAEQFISDVISQGSILPKVDFVTYTPSTLL